MSDSIDTSAAEAQVLKEQNSKMAEKLAKFEADELARAQAAEDAEKEALVNQLKAEKEAREAMEASFNEKLESISMRASTPGVPGGDDKPLTKEEYLANRAKYDTMALKAGTNMEGVFND